MIFRWIIPILICLLVPIGASAHSWSSGDRIRVTGICFRLVDILRVRKIAIEQGVPDAILFFNSRFSSCYNYPSGLEATIVGAITDHVSWGIYKARVYQIIIKNSNGTAYLIFRHDIGPNTNGSSV